MKCKEWSCRRDAAQVIQLDNLRDKMDAEDGYDEKVELLLNAVVCNIHAGGLKRRAQARWRSTYDKDIADSLVVIPNDLHEFVAPYFTEKARLARIELDARIEENQNTQAARFAQEWVERTLEPEFTITRGTDQRSYSDRFYDGYTVNNGERRGWDITVTVEQTGNYPSYVKVRNANELSPAAARVLAQAILLAANIADERDILNGPKGDE